MRFGIQQPDVSHAERALDHSQIVSALGGKPYHFPDQPEQKFSFCLTMLLYVKMTKGSATRALFARNFMWVMLEQWDYPMLPDFPARHFEIPLSNEPYWQMRVMRLLRPMGLLDDLVRTWAKSEFMAWTKLAKRYTF